LLTGRDPFQHVTGFVPLLQAHVSEDAAVPSAVAPQLLEPVLDAVVMRALAKRPQDRYTSAAELSAALVHATEHTGAREPRSWATGRPTAASQPARLLASRGASPRVACLLIVTSALLSALVAAALVRGP
jgi:serine/threonine-protein kinase